jgi:hypothetical protein
MKVLSVIRAESVRALRPIAGDLGYPPTAVGHLVKQYGFLGLPKSEDLANIDPAKGLTFTSGRLVTQQREIAIDFLQVFPSGLSVTTHTSTNESDFLLEHILRWSREQFGLDYEPLKTGTAHGSQLEVRLEKPLAELFPHLSVVSKAISDNLDPWWETKMAFELVHLNFGVDKSKYPAFPPQGFRLERRDGVPFEQNAYYSEAAMPTEKHIEVLSLLERTCIEKID